MSLGPGNGSCDCLVMALRLSYVPPALFARLREVGPEAISKLVEHGRCSAAGPVDALVRSCGDLEELAEVTENVLREWETAVGADFIAVWPESQHRTRWQPVLESVVPAPRHTLPCFWRFYTEVVCDARAAETPGLGSRTTMGSGLLGFNLRPRPEWGGEVRKSLMATAAWPKQPVCGGRCDLAAGLTRQQQFGLSALVNVVTAAMVSDVAGCRNGVIRFMAMFRHVWYRVRELLATGRDPFSQCGWISEED